MTSPEPAEGLTAPASSPDARRSGAQSLNGGKGSSDGPEISVGPAEEIALPRGAGLAAALPMTPDEVLTSGARTLAIGSLLGLCVAAYVRFAYNSRWVEDFLLKNALGAEPRKELIAVLVIGLLAGGALTFGGLVLNYRRTREIRTAEQWAWFLSPLLLLPLSPLFFRYRPWLGRHDVLLSLLVPVILAMEALVSRALENVPPLVLEWWESLREQVPELLRKHGALIIVVAGAITYAGFFTFYLLRWHYKLRTGNFDLSINNNLMYAGLHGELLKSTVAFPTDPYKYLAAHAKYGTYLFLPIYALVPRPETLLVIQSTLIGMSAIPLFAFARRHISQWMAAALALVYLVYYPMHGASFSEFQNVPIAGFFIFATVWAADARRWGWFWFFAIAALAMREDIPVGMAVIGSFLLLTGHRPLPGLALTSVSIVYFLFLRFYWMDEAGSWWFPNMYKELWADGEKGFKSVIKTLFTNPLFTLNKLMVEKKLQLMLHLLVPIAFLPARRWYLWAAFVPGALLTLLVTNYDPPTSFSFHYVMHWVPYVFMASAIALKAIHDERGAIRQRAAAAAMVTASLVLTYNYGAFMARNGSFKGQFNKIEFTFTDEEKARYETLKEIIKIIPPDASLAATEKVGPHVSSRRVLHTMRHGPFGAEYILASSRELKLSRTKVKLREVVEKGEYGVVKRMADFAVLKKGHDTSQNQELIDDWKLHN